MNATVLIEKIGKSKFRASTAQPIALASEGKSRDEAIRRLRQLASKRIADGELIQVDLVTSADANPWVKFAGIWKDHPEFEAFLADIASYRKSRKD
jgi:hypothetical protein